MINAINALGSAQEVSDAVAQVVPVVVGQSIQVGNMAMDDLGAVVSGRSGIASGDGYLNQGAVWAKPFASTTDQDTRDNVDGFEIDSVGIAFGIDGEYAPNFDLGYAVAYSNSDVKGKGILNSHSVDTDTYFADRASSLSDIYKNQGFDPRKLHTKMVKAYEDNKKKANTIL
mgnify:CR=1 FL=1